MHKIAIVMIHFGKRETTDAAIASLNTKIGNNKLLLIDNSVDNVGFARGVNRGIRQALKDPSFTHILLLNNDLSISSGTLDQLVGTFGKKSTAGIVSPVLHHAGGYDWGGKYNKWTGMVKHINWENKPKTTQTVDHVAGAAMLISREALDKVGLFDERFFLYFEDLDFCLRAKEAGFTMHINPDVVAEHAVSLSSSPIPRLFHQWRSHILFMLKYVPTVAYPTAFLYDAIFYPLVLLKLVIQKIIHYGN